MPAESSYQVMLREDRERQAAMAAQNKALADEARAEEEINANQKHTSSVTSGAAEPQRSDVNSIPAQKIGNADGYAAAWKGHAVLTCNGNFDSKIKTGADYSTITLGEIFNQADPARVDKGRAPAIICSTYHAFDGREHDTQRQRGQFVAIPGDIDKGNTPFDTVQRLVREFFGEGVAYLVYSTASSTEAEKHWRTLVPLVEPLAFTEWSALCMAFYGFMEANGCQMDWSLARAGQIAYLPNVPKAARKADGTPKFFVRDAQDGRGLTMADGLVQQSLNNLLAQREADTAALELARAEARAARQRRLEQRGAGNEASSVVDAFNAAHSIEELLVANLYEQSPVSDVDWRSPYQTSGSYATRVVDDHWISLSGTDSQAGLGAESKSGHRYGDAFDIYCHFDHGGNFTAAVKAAAAELGMKYQEGTEPRGKAYADIINTICGAAVMGCDPGEFSDIVLSAIAGSRGLTPSEVDDLLKRVKKETGVSLKALRDELQSRNDGADGQGLTHADYALQLLESLVDSTGEVRPVGIEGRIYTFEDDGVFRGRLAGDYEVEVGKRFSGMKNCQRRGDYLGVAAHAYAIAAQGNEGFFSDAPIGLACPDGFYRLSTDGGITVEPLGAEHRQRFVLRTSPVPGMPTPLFDRYLADTFASEHPHLVTEQIAQLQEIMGAVVFGLMARHEKVALFYGPGRAGKGTALKIIEELVPREWHAASSPFRWDAEYYLADLAGKRLNVVGELPEEEPIPAAHFKTVTGRDLLTGRHPTGKPFTFRNEAAHIFNTNHFVNTRDHSEAFFTRWLIVGFLNSRLGRGDEAIDADLAEHIVHDELGGVLAWAMDGAKRLQKRGRFQVTATHTKLLGQWRRRTDSVLEFLHDSECVELQVSAAEGEGFMWKRADLYADYVTWCYAAGRKPMGKHKVFEALEAPAAMSLGLKVARDPVLREVVLGARRSRLEQHAQPYGGAYASDFA
ncbi:MAG: hypothetical protein RIS88_1689 [Pseudomonadota bacterium]|jgi:putative DNA primase/helicase